MLGGRATPRVWNSVPAQPVVGVRRMKRLPSCSTSTSWRRSRSRRSSAHSGVEVGRGEAVLERLAQDEGEEGAEHVAADGGIALVEDRPGGQQGLGAAEQLLDSLQIAVAQHRLERVERGVGAQHEDAVEAGVLGDPLVVDREADLGRLQEAAVAEVADQRLVAVPERLAQAGHDRLPIGGVLVGLGQVADRRCSGGRRGSPPWLRARCPADPGAR